MIEAVKSRWHPILQACEVTIGCLMISKVNKEGERFQALKHGGYPAQATIQVSSTKNRALDMPDAVLIIDAANWDDLSVVQREALIDHELYHLQVAAVEGGVVGIGDDGQMSGEPKSDDLGRPVLKMRLHDWQIGGFTAVVARHGAESGEVRQVRTCLGEDGQYVWDRERTVTDPITNVKPRTKRQIVTEPS
jgi:hypothetical protein